MRTSSISFDFSTRASTSRARLRGLDVLILQDELTSRRADQVDHRISKDVPLAVGSEQRLDPQMAPDGQRFQQLDRRELHRFKRRSCSCSWPIRLARTI
jgi:hypothetical protein